jgi:hypothetical protein
LGVGEEQVGVELRSAFAELVRNANRLGAGAPVAVPATYLLSRGTVLER